MRHSAQSCTGSAKTKWQRTCSSESDEYHYKFGVIKLYFTSDVILKITKSEEYYNSRGLFLHKIIFFEQRGIHVAKTESLSTCRIFSKLLFCRQFCRQNACRRPALVQTPVTAAVPLGKALLSSLPSPLERTSSHQSSVCLLLKSMKLEIRLHAHPGGISSSVLSVFFTNNCYKLLKSLHLIGWEQICQWKTLTKRMMKCPPGWHKTHDLVSK